MDLKEVVSHLKEGLHAEMNKAKKLEGEKLSRFCEIVNIPEEDAVIYYTEYNLIITNQDIFESLQYLIKPQHIILEVKIKSRNVFLVIYEYISDGLFDNYLTDPSEDN